MEKLLYNVSQILGTTIIHSLWQGLLIYTALRLIFLAVLGLSSEKKHNLAMLALFSMVAWFGYTFYTEFNAYDWSPAVSNYQLSDNVSLALYNTYIASAPLHPATFADYKAEFFSNIKTYLPYITALYAIGLLFNLGRLGLAWNQIRVIKQNMIGNLSLQQKVNTLAKKLGIRKPVQLSFSERVDGPCVVNFIKPILLLPVTITTQLSADEVEAILIHELSHIQSNDYLLNVLQQLITVLLFFNPFTILLNRIISTERENRCDDIVVATTGDPLIYAQALLKLEETRQTNLTLALAATGNKYHLLTRIERIMKSTKPTGNFKHLILAMVILAGSLGSISWLNPEIESGKIIFKKTAAKVLNNTTEEPIAVAASAKSPSKKKAHLTIVADDTSRLTQLIDTTKKVKKPSVKIVYEDADGNKKEYNSLNELPAEARQELLGGNRIFNSLRFDTARFANLGKRFNSNFNNEISKETSDEIRRAIAKAKVMSKIDMKKLQKQSAELSKYYTSPQFKKQVEKLAKGSADLSKMYDSPEFKKQLEDITKASVDFADKSKHSSEDWAKATEELTKQSMKFSQDFLNSEEWKKYQNDIVNQALDVAKMQQNSAETRQKTKELADKIREEVRKVAEDTRKRNIIERKELKEKTEVPELPKVPEGKAIPERPELPAVPNKQ